MTTRVTRNGTHVILTAPYHPNLPAAAKQIGGRFDGTSKEWTFDARDEERVRDLARSIYGSDGSEPVQLVTIRYTLDASDAREQVLWVAGREVARRTARDAAVKLGKGVILIEGRFPSSGGSTKYPVLAGYNTAAPGIVLEIRDVPATLVTLDEQTVIVDTAPAPEAPSPLASFTVGQLLAELVSRGAMSAEQAAVLAAQEV
jgi:hypothetical protein